MNAYRIVFADGRQVTGYGKTKAAAYRSGCRIAKVPATTLTRAIVPVPRPPVTW